MADATAIRSGQNSLLDAQAAQLLQRIRGGATNGRPDGVQAAAQDGKIDKSSKDFESILLGSWLQGAEQSFAKVPGGDDDDDDGSKEQLQSIATQALASAMTKSGGIGIANMIAKSLRSSIKESAVT